jgi:hypothetical protein
MGDVIFVAVIIGLFALAALFVRACEGIIGPEEVTTLPAEAAEDEATGELVA